MTPGADRSDDGRRARERAPDPRRPSSAARAAADAVTASVVFVVLGPVTLLLAGFTFTVCLSVLRQDEYTFSGGQAALLLGMLTFLSLLGLRGAWRSVSRPPAGVHGPPTDGPAGGGSSPPDAVRSAPAPSPRSTSPSSR